MKDTLFIVSESNLGYKETVQLLDKYNKEYISVKINEIDNDELLINDIIEKYNDEYIIISLDGAILHIEDNQLKLNDIEYIEFSSFEDFELGERNSSYALLKLYLDEDDMDVHEYILNELMSHIHYSIDEDLENIKSVTDLSDEELNDELQNIARDFHIQTYMYLENDIDDVDVRKMDNYILYTTDNLSLEYALDKNPLLSLNQKDFDYIVVDSLEEMKFIIHGNYIEDENLLPTINEIHPEADYYLINDAIYNDLTVILLNKNEIDENTIERLHNILNGYFGV